MKFSSRFIEKGFEVALITLMIFAAEAPCMAQHATNTDAHSQTMKNAGKHIHLAENLNPDAKAKLVSPLINSPYAEHKPYVSHDGKRLYFSRYIHPENTGGAKDPEDIWYSEKDSITGAWTKPEVMKGIFNNSAANRINGISVTGDTIILDHQYLGKGKMKPGLSYSVRKEKDWLPPTAIKIRGDHNVSPNRDAHVALGIGVIISCVQRKDTFGERDLYVSFWDGEEASQPVNMGGVINSNMDESSPFLSNDFKTLYFASKGHQGYGGFDIYMTKRLDNSWTNWSSPVNLGPAINGPLDEESLIFTHSEQFAFFSRQITVHNVDLFFINTADLFVSKRMYR
ncbi:MAG: hypothetical protein SH819_11185 [Cytophagales bacterium]|nr:hypothetical protein [Cytophagales bacterium]